MNKKDVSINTLFGIPFISASQEEVIELLTSQIESKGETGESLQIVFTPNPEQVTLSFHSSAFKSALLQSTYNLPDGQGIVWALARKNRRQTYHRIPGRVIFHHVLTQAADRAWKVFLLGGRRGSAVQVLEKYQHSGRSLGWQYDGGAEDIRHETEAERQRVLKLIKEYRPQVVFVAYGAPWQEQWVIENRDALEASGVRLVMVVGGAFEYEAGLVRAVPQVIEHVHLEWLWRLVLEPWRWKRQLKGLEFFWRVLLGLGT